MITSQRAVKKTCVRGVGVRGLGPRAKLRPTAPLTISQQAAWAVSSVMRGTRTPPTMLRASTERPRGGLHDARALQQTLSTLGGGGNRTRVLQYITRASPGAACCGFLSPGGLAG